MRITGLFLLAAAAPLFFSGCQSLSDAPPESVPPAQAIPPETTASKRAEVAAPPTEANQTEARQKTEAHQTDSREPGARDPVTNLPPEDLEIDSIWSYLESKYDRDGNGIIVLADYDRGEDRFSRLDRNQDERLTAEDFARSRGMMSPERMNAMISQMVVMSHFQSDDDGEKLALHEVQSSFATYDGNGDGFVDAAEFDSERKARGAKLPRMLRSRLRDRSPFSLLQDSVDKDEDARLSLEELTAYFRGRDSDGDDVWVAGGGSSRRSNRSREDGVAHEGEFAPDFTLSSPNGGIPITLSAFRGKKPVALIFGSYT